LWARPARGQVENLARVIGAAIVEHDDLVINDKRTQGAVSDHDHAGDRTRIVLRREEAEMIATTPRLRARVRVPDTGV